MRSLSVWYGRGTRVFLLLLAFTVLTNSTAFSAGGLQTESILYQQTGYVVATAGDFNGDGIPDIALVAEPITSGSSTIKVFLGNGDGTFKTPSIDTVTSLTGVDQLAIGDFNRDGKLDLAQATNAGLLVTLGNGDGTFASATLAGVGGGSYHSISAADLNGDGAIDLVASGRGAGSIGVFLGNGDGTFRLGQTIVAGVNSLIIADLNGDHRPDLAYISTESGTFAVSVRLNNGDGTFGSFVALPGASVAVTVADVNGDGKPDLVVSGVQCSTLGECMGEFVGNGDGTFQPLVTLSGTPSAVTLLPVDLNRDREIDLVLGSGGSDIDTVGLATGNGDGSFNTTSWIPGSVFDSNGGIMLADFNSDGAPDVLTYSQEPNVAVGVLLNCNQGCTSITLTAPNTASYGNVNISATVKPSTQLTTPSGTVTFYVGPLPYPVHGPFVATNQFTANLVNGTASVNAGKLDPSQYRFYAVYSGDASYANNRTAVSPVFRIDPAPTSVAITVSPSSVSDGQGVTMTAQVSSALAQVPTGSATLQDGGVTIATVPLDASGVASYSYSSFATGHHNLTWLYSGDKDFATATSAAFDLYVGPPDFSVTSTPASSATQTVTAGQNALYQLSLSPLARFSGTVTFSCSGVPRGAVCSFTPPSLNVSGTSAQPFTVGISTTTNTIAAFLETAGPTRGLTNLSWFFASCVAALCFLPTRRRTRTGLGALAVLGLTSVLLIASCGGGGSQNPPPQNGTPAGTYTVVIAATAGATVHSQNLTLVVH